MLCGGYPRPPSCSSQLSVHGRCQCWPTTLTLWYCKRGLVHWLYLGLVFCGGWYSAGSFPVTQPLCRHAGALAASSTPPGFMHGGHPHPTRLHDHGVVFTRPEVQVRSSRWACSQCRSTAT